MTDTRPSAPSLAGKTALVTGAGSGLGKAIATTFLQAGANVIFADVNAERLSAAEKELSPSHGAALLTAEVDVSSEASVAALFESAVAKFGGVDVVVNNAGIMDKFDAVGTLDKEIWDRVLAVNTTGPYLVSRAAVQSMLRKAGEGAKAKGVILNVSSLAGAFGLRAGAAYTTSKHALIGMTKHTAAFYGPKGIRCNAILPGGMTTNVQDAFMKDGKLNANMEGLQLMMAWEAIFKGTSELSDMANLCLFLCSDTAVVLNGACVNADGGWAAH